MISPVNNRVATLYHYTNSSSSSFLSFYLLQIFTLSIQIMFNFIPFDANDPHGLMRRLAPNKQTITVFSYGFLFNCSMVGQVSDSMTALM